jgi:pimeloyl-ACP methyl ester carboxylesterase
MRRTFLPVLLVVVLSSLCCPVGRTQIAADDEKGKVVTKKGRYGEYVQYLPQQQARSVLVIAHGMPSDEEAKDIFGLAEKFLKRWVADAHLLVALAPAFDDENFDSVQGAHGGGYGGLFGRQVGADAFVNLVVEQYKPHVKSWNGRILVYGHSVGGQFANPYCVWHPDRAEAAVISAAGGYAMPDPNVPWPNGMGPWKTSFRWDPTQKPQPVNVSPHPSGWLRAAILPLTVVVGTADTEEQKPRAGHTGKTRLGRAHRPAATFLTSGSSVCAWLMKTFIIRSPFGYFPKLPPSLSSEANDTLTMMIVVDFLCVNIWSGEIFSSRWCFWEAVCDTAAPT